MLLLDENLPVSLIEVLAPRFSGASHVRLTGLGSATDRQIWDFAKSIGFAIVSKDSDFRQLAFLFGPPPKFIWLRMGNASVSKMRAELAGNFERIETFLLDSSLGMLVVD